MTDSQQKIIHPTLPPALQDFAPARRHGDSSMGWSPARQKAFIAALAETGSIGRACAEVESPLPVAHR